MYAFLSSPCRKPGDRLDRWNWWTQFNSGRVYPAGAGLPTAGIHCGAKV